ncbi:hypothetical protein [Halobacillus hunanensis]|uniref:hypothetical protein n=1 Tax=Halobacillus hunanensis TaxID=578214 RepID=UPI00159291D3|nr:hypothetical protein [Halobacillus hunanensis]
MWDNIVGRFPTTMIIICTALSFAVPMAVYKVNQAIHQHGDPPWKKNKDKQTNQSK